MNHFAFFFLSGSEELDKRIVSRQDKESLHPDSITKSGYRAVSSKVTALFGQ